MATCFVIQPFDSGKYDKRYRECFKLAIEDAGLVPYRVDEDPQADIAIDSIETGIANSAACLADISEDWPAAGFTDTQFGCDDETGGGKWQRERSLESSSLRL